MYSKSITKPGLCSRWRNMARGYARSRPRTPSASVLKTGELFHRYRQYRVSRPHVSASFEFRSNAFLILPLLFLKTSILSPLGSSMGSGHLQGGTKGFKGSRDSHRGAMALGKQPSWSEDDVSADTVMSMLKPEPLHSECLPALRLELSESQEEEGLSMPYLSMRHLCQAKWTEEHRARGRSLEEGVNSLSKGFFFFEGSYDTVVGTHTKWCEDSHIGLDCQELSEPKQIKKHPCLKANLRWMSESRVGKKHAVLVTQQGCSIGLSF